MNSIPADMGNLERLKIMPRYVSGQIRLGNLIINYNDPLALYNEYKDIFINRIYDFQPKHEHPVVIDVGGYIGLSAIRFNQIQPNAKIHVFEPDPTIFHLLTQNMEQNGITNANLINAGIAKSKGDVSFFPDGADGGNVFNRTRGEIDEIKADMLKLSAFIEDEVDLLKMNVEGMEGEIFEEIEEKLPLIDQIIFEYHAFHNLSQNLGNILERLDRNGFRYLVAQVPCAQIPVPFRMHSTYRNFNLVYARKQISL